MMTTSSISTVIPTPADTTILMMVDATRTLLEGVSSTLYIVVVIETVLIVDVVKCELDSKICDCDDGVSAEYVDTVKQFLSITICHKDHSTYCRR